MALISLNNFIEPFKRPVHLVSICLLAGLIGVWRASGGSIELERNGAPPPRTETPRQAPAAVAPARTYNKSKKNLSARPDLDSLLKKEDKLPSRNKPAPRDKSALDDIEKTLGLRS